MMIEEDFSVGENKSVIKRYWECDGFLIETERGVCLC